MKKYIVIALSVGGLGNKIFNYGDEVTESHFDEGHADKLVEQGFLKTTALTDDDLKAEQDRIAKEKAANDLLEQEKAEQERLRLEAEQKEAEQLEIKKAEELKLLQELEEQDRIAKEKAAQESKEKRK